MEASELIEFFLALSIVSTNVLKGIHAVEEISTLDIYLVTLIKKGK